ncbi:MAG: glycosyltransferase [Thermoguttaceae bacterium]|jgi:dolichol-phosphate mannosyltransferase
MRVSVVLPTYNEIDNIVVLVESIISHVPREIQYEILVIDDNSPDQTYEAVRSAFSGNPAVVPVLRTSDRGLAKSIRAGVERTSGDLVVLMDTDFNHNPADLPRMLHLAQVCDVVVGSRFCAGGSMPDLLHYCLSLAYNWLIRIVLRTQIQDNLSGFVAIDAKLLRRLPYDVIFHGYGDYFFRLLHCSQREGAAVLEMPVQYLRRKAGRSKSVFWRLLFKYTYALFKFRLSYRKHPCG